MADFEIITGDENNILSLKRLSDGLIFSVGDNVDLVHSIKEGTCDGHIIERFMTENDRSHNNMDAYKNATPFPKGTIVTKEGVIQLENVGFTDFTSDIYKIMNTPLNLSVRDLIRITNFKHKGEFIKIAKKAIN